LLKKNALLLLGVMLLVAAPLWWFGGSHEFNGTDDQAQALITRIQPAYQPWRTAIFEPDERSERFLFAFQALAGASGLAYCLWRLRVRSLR
jgi:cobalt/nickel transport protein